MRSIEILIIGGGASGMLAGIAAGRAGAKVMIVEKMNQLGKKILATGNGKCNYTNYTQYPKCYHATQDSQIWQAIKCFDYNDTVNLFRELGIYPSDRDGYVYPMSGQAVSVRNVLERELKALKTEIHLEETVEGIATHLGRDDNMDGYVVKTSKGKYLAHKVIMSVGGMASPVHGSDGSGYGLLRKLGHHIIEPLPALTSCILDESFTKLWAGVRVRGKVTAYSGAHLMLGEDTGELQFVATGISGIPVFQISRYISLELSQKSKPYLVIDIMPDCDEDDLYAEFKRRVSHGTMADVMDLFEGLMHHKLSDAVLKKLGIKKDLMIDDIQDEQLQDIVKLMKSWKLKVDTTADFTKSQVTCGGVSLDEIDMSSMESKLCKHLYITGELMDVDAICGGYNLQWAWTSGYIAGTSAAR